jgi:hypothetical protein
MLVPSLVLLNSRAVESTLGVCGLIVSIFKLKRFGTIEIDKKFYFCYIFTVTILTLLN